MPYIEILMRKNTGQRFDLQGEMRIGRSSENDICLSSSLISRYHARIFRDDSRFLLEDLRSSNGTELCGIRIPPNTPYQLTDGNVITIGPFRLRFRETVGVVDRNRLPIEINTPSAGEYSAFVTAPGILPSNTKMLQLFDDDFLSPVSIITRDASIDLKQIAGHQPRTPQETQQACRRLQAICQINANLGAITNFSTMIELLLDSLLEIYPKAERAFVLLITPGQSNLTPFAAKSRQKKSIDLDKIILSDSIINTARYQNCAILSTNTFIDSRFESKESVINNGIKSFICSPISVDDDFIGIIQLDDRDSIESFDTNDLEILTAIVAQMSLVIKNLHLINKLRFEIELKEKTEYILKKSELHYRALAEVAPVGVYRTDALGSYIYVNELWSVITGLTSEEAFGPGWINALHIDDRDTICYKWAEAVQSQRPFQAEYRFQHRDGSIKWVYGQAVTERLDTDIVSGFVGTITDITEHKVAEAEREELQKQLVDISRQAGMAELATNVLHNVGNVLNSINVSASLLTEQFNKSAVDSLAKANLLIQDHVVDLGQFVTEDKRGKHFPRLLNELSIKLVDEQQSWIHELDSMVRHINHIKEVVAMQQSYARVSGLQEEISLAALTEDALRTIAVSLRQSEIELVRDFSALPTLWTDKHKVLQILVNLLANAKDALGDMALVERRLVVRLFQPSAHRVAVEVTDTGAGISASHLTRIFEYGFTTKPEGHGFGLHSCGLMAKELGGELTARSEGVGCGSTFRLEIPVDKA